MVKEKHPRIGENTEIANPHSDFVYGELCMGATTLMYDAEESPANKIGYRLVTRVWDRSAGKTEFGAEKVYENIDEIDQETAHQILDSRNNGEWGYVE